MRITITLLFFLHFWFVSGQSKLDSLLIRIEMETGEQQLSTASDFLEDKLDSAKWYKANFNFYNDQNKYALAFSFGEEAAKLFLHLNDTSSWLSVNHSLMVSNVRIGSFEEGLLKAQNAYDLSAAIKDTAEIIHYLSDIGWIYHDYKQYEKGVEYAKRSLKLAFDYTESTPHNFYDPYNIIAVNFDDWNIPDSALHYHFLNLANTKKMTGSDTAKLSQLYNNIGNTYRKKKDYQQSLKYLKKALEIDLVRNNVYSLATVYTNLGDVASNMDDRKLASTYLIKASFYAEESNSVEKQLDTYEAYYKFYNRKEDFQNAFQFQDKFYSLSDSLFKEETSQKLALMEVRFDTEKKEQQIALQEAEIAEQKAELLQNRILLFASIIAISLIIIIGILLKNRIDKKQQIALQQERINTKETEITATISSQEKERARYARDLHDGFGQMISILNMNLGSLKKDSKPDDRQKVFEESEKVIEEMYDELKGICFDLMPQTLVNNGLQNGLEEFIERINKADKLFIETNFFGLEERLTELEEISLYRITQEWVNNILKYSDADKITLQITRDQEEITLLIEDNGSGFDKALLLDSKGNGWKNLNTRTNLINGSLELETQLGINGNTLIVNAPSALTPQTEALEVHS